VWNADSAFNAQGSRVFIVVVQVGAPKISCSRSGGYQKKERRDENQFTIKIGGKTSLDPAYFGLIKFPFPVTYINIDALLCQNW